MFIQSNIPAHEPIVAKHAHTNPPTPLGSSLVSAWYVPQQCLGAKVCVLGIKSSIMTEKVLRQHIRIQETWSKVCLSAAVFMSVDSHQGAQEKILITKTSSVYCRPTIYDYSVYLLFGFCPCYKRS